MIWLSFFLGASVMWIVIGLIARWSNTRENIKLNRQMRDNQMLAIAAAQRTAECLERIEAMLDEGS